MAHNFEAMLPSVLTRFADSPPDPRTIQSEIVDESLACTPSKRCRQGSIVGKYATKSLLVICPSQSFPVCLRQTVVNISLRHLEANLEI